jgi:hypothetical protein
MKGPLHRALEELGLPATNGNGHAIGCVCEGCQAYREEALRTMRANVADGKPPTTLGEILMHARKTAREKKH